MMTKKQIQSLSDDLQAKYFQGMATNDLETEAETFAQIEILSWVMGDNHGIDRRNKRGFSETYTRARRIPETATCNSGTYSRK